MDCFFRSIDRNGLVYYRADFLENSSKIRKIKPRYELIVRFYQGRKYRFGMYPIGMPYIIIQDFFIEIFNGIFYGR